MLTTLQFALVLTIAAISAALPRVLFVTMAVVARMLAEKVAMVTRLVVREELAGVDVPCADKTGALTQNKLTIGDPFIAGGIPAVKSSPTPRRHRAQTKRTSSTWPYRAV
jgi:H+-transporting ATPase